eukprot:scaffold85520_cov36-Prasinocladus_malaysianus.AAC.3
MAGCDWIHHICSSRAKICGRDDRASTQTMYLVRDIFMEERDQPNTKIVKGLLGCIPESQTSLSAETWLYAWLSKQAPMKRIMNLW